MSEMSRDKDIQRKILFLAKAFSEENHAKAFLRGDLHVNRLANFKKMRIDDDPRADSEEGIIPWRDDGVAKAILIPQGRPHETITMYGPGSMQIGRINSLNVLCMYAALFGAEERVLWKDIEVPEEYVKFGSHAVLITDSAKFIERIECATRREGYSLWRRAVKYVDPSVFDIRMMSEEIDMAFHKRLKYAEEKEYRFAIETNTCDENPITLNIGSIEDVAVHVNTSDINIELRRRIHDIVR